ncbi:MAG TPA: serine hydrolase, partial [Thermoanaerobaculia bacterium]|nr:serine hydrolase [Thermoanaerobaculia bacterium]
MKKILLALLLAGCATASQPPKPAVDAAVNEAIAEKRIPGAVLLIEHDGKVYQRAYGNRAVEPAVEPMTADTIFDVASITKVVATAPSIAKLVERGKVSLDAPVQTYLPGYADERVTVRHLLTHTSGIRPSLDLREDWTGYDEGIRRALAERPLNRPGTIFRYADVNYILLGEIVRRVSGEPLDVFARKNVFAPLGMRDTGFRVVESSSRRVVKSSRSSRRLVDSKSRRLEDSTTRIAPTENGLRGVVHDPTARRMGGVAGHAGLFTTAADLAKFARWAMKSRLGDDITPPEVAIRRAFGFDLDSAYSRPRGDLFPYGSFGHTGWTGGFLWIDPSSRTFYVFLSNRVHPDGKGSVIALQRRLGTEIARSIGLTAPVPRRVGIVTGGGDAMNGIDVLHASNYEALRGLRIGLITNQSGIDRTGNPTVDLLRGAPGVTLAAIFTPEHGLRGTADDERVADEQYRGIPVFSLYNERRKPSPEQLAGLDALVFDIQDVGTRFYTYISTMGLAMEAAAEAKIRFIVLDRVNPIG